MHTIFKSHKYFLCVLLAIAILTIFTICSFSTAAETRQDSHKYFHTIQVKDGDSLWSIANQYMPEQYDSVDEYIDEVCSLNHIDGTVIQEGWNLLIPYYATEPGLL